MANQDDDKSAAEKHKNTFSSDDLMDSDLLIDSDELIDSDLLIDVNELVDSNELIDSDDFRNMDDHLEGFSQALDRTDANDDTLYESLTNELEDLDDAKSELEELPSSQSTEIENPSSETDNLELSIPEHAIAEEAQHAAERASKTAEEAEIKATQEAQIAIDAKAAAEAAMAAFDAAEIAAAEAKAVAETTAKAESKAAEEAQAALDAEVKAIAEAKAKAEEEARIKAEEEARIKAEEEARIKAEEEARIKAEEEARIKAEEEARIKAEEEARIKAEEEARIKAEEEARIKAEEEARIKAEEEARIKAEEEARIKAEEEARIKAEEEARIKAEEEARIKAEEEARIKAEEEARIKAEEEARIKLESEKIKKDIESQDLLSLNLDEDEAPSQGDELETLSSLEEELGELTDWVEPEFDSALTAASMDINETPNIQTSEQSIPDAGVVPERAFEKEAPPTIKKIKDDPMADNKKSGLNRLILSSTLISMVIAALAIWMSLDASQQIANLAQEPIKLQKQIDQMNEHQEKQTLLLQEQIENLQQQLKILTNVVSHKESEKWRAAVEIPTNEKIKLIKKAANKPIAAKPAPVATKKIAKLKVRPSVRAIKRIKPVVINTPAIASEFAAAPGSVKGWVIYLFSTMSQKSAEHETRQFQKKKIDAKYLRTLSKGKVWYHVLVDGFESERKAAAFKKFLKEYHGIDSYYSKSANPIDAQKTKKVTPVKKAATNKNPVLKKSATVSHTYRFQAVGSEVWLQIYAPNKNVTKKGQLLKEVLLKAGHHITIKAASESLWITAGNAPALSISVDDKVIAKNGSLGTGKKVLRNYRFSINK